MKLITLTCASISAIKNSLELKLLCLATDAILLRQDAVYLLKRPDLTWPTTQLYALDIDLQARNIQATANPNVTIISAAQWVELTIEASQNILWQQG